MNSNHQNHSITENTSLLVPSTMDSGPETWLPTPEVPIGKSCWESERLNCQKREKEKDGVVRELCEVWNMESHGNVPWIIHHYVSEIQAMLWVRIDTMHSFG
jgi:hypothetical protein